jgi:hypothetical protein
MPELLTFKYKLYSVLCRALYQFCLSRIAKKIGKICAQIRTMIRSVIMNNVEQKVVHRTRDAKLSSELTDTTKTTMQCAANIPVFHSSFSLPLAKKIRIEKRIS